MWNDIVWGLCQLVWFVYDGAICLSTGSHDTCYPSPSDLLVGKSWQKVHIHTYSYQNVDLQSTSTQNYRSFQNGDFLYFQTRLAKRKKSTNKSKLGALQALWFCFEIPPCNWGRCSYKQNHKHLGDGWTKQDETNSSNSVNWIISPNNGETTFKLSIEWHVCSGVFCIQSLSLQKEPTCSLVPLKTEILHHLACIKPCK